MLTITILRPVSVASDWPTTSRSMIVGPVPLFSLYLPMCALSMVGALLVPFAAFALYGATMASYFQLTRVIVVESSAPEARGRVSAAMTAVVKVASIGGSVIATAMVHHATALFLAAATVAMVAAAAAGARRRVAVAAA